MDLQELKEKKPEDLILPPGKVGLPVKINYSVFHHLFQKIMHGCTEFVHIE